MRVKGTTIAVCMLLGSAATGIDAEAAVPKRAHGSNHASSASHHAKSSHARMGQAGYRADARRYGRSAHATGGDGAGISCVPYARAVTGMAITGNGGTWWDNAAGAYDRGQRPEPGSVMAFRSSGGMSRGHVAVVSRVLRARQVLIDHANWGGPGIARGSVMHNVSVVDVSDDNDWTAVRVQVGYDTGSFGKVYPTYGFIYNRPETGTAYASAPSQRGLRLEQVAEMPSYGTRDVAFRTQGVAPLRSTTAHRQR